MWVSTFHSACVRILRRDGHRLGYPSSFTIYDQADAQRLIGYVLRDLNLDAKRFPPRSVHAMISAAKNDDCRPDEYAARAEAFFERKIADVFIEYQARLLRPAPWTSTTFCQHVELFRTDPEVLEHYRRRFRHVLVDEYQDTNRVQNELVLHARRGAPQRLRGRRRGPVPPPGHGWCAPPIGELPIEQLAGVTRCSGPWRSGRWPRGQRREVVLGQLPGRIVRVACRWSSCSRGTPHHIVPARHRPSLPDQLARVPDVPSRSRVAASGRRRAVRSDSLGRARRRIPASGANQEHADRLLDPPGRVTRRRGRGYWESWFAGGVRPPDGVLPRCRSATWRWTRSGSTSSTPTPSTPGRRAKHLLDDLHLHPDFPHLPPGERRAAPRR